MRARFAKLTAIVVFATLVLAAPALAYSLVYYDGYALRGDLLLGPRHSLTESSLRVLDSYSSSCTGAYDLEGTRVGTPYCTSGLNSVAAHPYCGCQLRYPAAQVVAVPDWYSGGYLRARENY